MSFSVPTFNLVCQLYTSGELGLLRVTTPCNLAFGRRVNAGFPVPSEPAGIPTVYMQLLLPPLTDIRSYSSSTGADLVYLVGDTSRAYTVTFVDDIGKGFVNEHRFALLLQLSWRSTPLQ